VSLQDQFAQDLTAAHPSADIHWVAGDAFGSAFRLSPDVALRIPANANIRPASWQLVLKRALDLAIAVPALLIVSPLLLLLALIVKLDVGGPVFFRQTRLGKDAKPFDIFKLRTMTVMENGGAVQQARRGDARVTRSGRFLRKTSLDELPQLLNVVLGDMSLVGPRPHAQAHDRHYGAHIAHYALRQSVKPGMTGWAQINGHRGETRTIADMRARVDFDIFYAKNASLAFDLLILVLTPFEVLRGRNAH
jgi:putative colanic acid biosysnthesis UDP-glucose lipid carrier transferase